MRKGDNLFMNMTFCFPHFDIELTKKQAECIGKRITTHGGNVIEHADSLEL